MTKNNGRRMWQTPWGYPESIAMVGGILGIGALLQYTVGGFDFYLLACPVNLIASGCIAALCMVLGVVARRSSFVRWFTGAPLSVTLILAFVLLAILMGLTPQTASPAATGQGASAGSGWWAVLGWNTMTSSWPFVLVYLFTLLVLGTLIVRRLTAFRLRNYAFYLNHIGLWLLLAASGLGYADMERYVMYVQEGQTEWRVYDDNKQVKELPIAIELRDFDMDVYPPKLAVIDRGTGEVQPTAQPEYFQIDPDAPRGTLNGWEVEVDEYIHQAVRGADSTFRAVPMPGATPAVKVKAVRNEAVAEGWVCGGNQAQIYMTLPLTDRYSLVMTTAEPRCFTSDITVYTQEGKNTTTLLEVNKPLRIGSWTVYQYGYDNAAGRLSSYSSFELVYDPWLVPVYIGIILLMLGSACLLWTGRKRTNTVNEEKEVQHDVE